MDEKETTEKQEYLRARTEPITGLESLPYFLDSVKLGVQKNQRAGNLELGLVAVVLHSKPEDILQQLVKDIALEIKQVSDFDHATHYDGNTFLMARRICSADEAEALRVKINEKVGLRARDYLMAFGTSYALVGSPESLDDSIKLIVAKAGQQ